MSPDSSTASPREGSTRQPPDSHHWTDGPEGETTLHLRGEWCIDGGFPPESDLRAVRERLAKARLLLFDASQLGPWDSSLLVFLRRVTEEATRRNLEVRHDALPEGVRKLLDLAAAVPSRASTTDAPRPSVVAAVGMGALRQWAGARDLMTFLGEAVIALGVMLRGRARFRRIDLLTAIQDCGPRALPIVSLISFLVGLILAFVGAIQLQKFGAEIFVADLVGIAIVREMGAVMSGIIMAGRTGASFAAQLGTMTVNEEIDALRTMGLSPMEFLVAPRMVALGLMMPLLCLYADLIGMLGGFVVGVGMLDLTPVQYWEETKAALTLTHFAVGLSKSVVFGLLIALAGCLRGMRCGRSASDVGDATTSAVVTAIVWIIVVDALFAVLTNILDV